MHRYHFERSGTWLDISDNELESASEEGEKVHALHLDIR